MSKRSKAAKTSVTTRFFIDLVSPRHVLARPPAILGQNGTKLACWQDPAMTALVQPRAPAGVIGAGRGARRHLVLTFSSEAAPVGRLPLRCADHLELPSCSSSKS